MRDGQSLPFCPSQLSNVNNEGHANFIMILWTHVILFCFLHCRPLHCHRSRDALPVDFQKLPHIAAPETVGGCDSAREVENLGDSELV